MMMGKTVYEEGKMGFFEEMTVASECLSLLLLRSSNVLVEFCHEILIVEGRSIGS